VPQKARWQPAFRQMPAALPHKQSQFVVHEPLEIEREMLMLNQIRVWMRPQVALWVAWLAASAASQAKANSYSELSPEVQKDAQSLFQAPTLVNLQKVRSLLVADSAYNPYSDDLNQLSTLVRTGKHRDAIALFARSLPNLALSPRAHDLASKAAEALGDKETAQVESRYRAACIEAILTTGDGSETQPFKIARLSDEADLLATRFGTRIGSQGLVFHEYKQLDRVFAMDGTTYWFDVSMLFERNAPPAGSLAATSGTQSIATAQGVDASGGAAASTVTLSGAAASSGTATTSGTAASSGAQSSGTASVVPAIPTAEAAAAALRMPPLPTAQSADDEPGKAAAQRGRDAYRAGKFDAALTALDEAIHLEPKNASYRVDRGNVLFVTKETAKAVADFSEAIRLDPRYATAYSNRALAWTTLGEMDQAITDFNAAIRLKSNFGRAYNGRGYAFEEKGMLDTAIADFDVAIGLDPNYAAAYENRSLAYAKKGNKELADADAAKASELRKPKSRPAESTTASTKN
jgi:Flp pilus assembly protein TadD